MGEFVLDNPWSFIDLIFLLAVPWCPLQDHYSIMTPAPRTLGVDLGSWAGDRIILLGDYAETWPAGKILPTDFELNSNIHSPLDFYNMSTSISTRFFNYDWQLEEPYPPNHIWILRNLTKKIYIRSNGIPTARDDKTLTYDEHQGFAGIPGLTHVLFSRIAWSDDSSISMGYRDHAGLCRGAWAGDRFDVRIFEDVEPELIREGWVDNTRIEARRAYELWTCEMENPFDFLEEPEMADSDTVEAEIE